MDAYITEYGLVYPRYSIHEYNDRTYKIIRYKGARGVLGGRCRSGTATEKLDSSISRAKATILEYALCNEWKYFVTLTLDPEKYVRDDLGKFRKDLLQWVRDWRKKSNLPFDYVLVPELHEKGGWHLHGLFTDIPNLISFKALSKSGVKLPRKLINSDYLCWLEYSKKFGWCSVGEIKNLEATSFYLTKYITKDLARGNSAVGSHLYFASRGLNRKVKRGEVYSPSQFLDSFLTHDYPFCKTGWTDARKPMQDWTFALDLIDGVLIPMNSVAEEETSLEWEKFVEITETSFFGGKYEKSYNL